MSEAIIVKEDVSVAQNPSRVLGAEPSERVVSNRELIVTPTESPEQCPGASVNLRDFSHVAERDHVITIRSKVKGIGMVEIERRVHSCRLDPVLRHEVIPCVPEERDLTRG